MRLTEILKPQNILVPMQAKTKNEAIGELVALLAKNNEIQDAKAVLDAVLERETDAHDGDRQRAGDPAREVQRYESTGDGDWQAGYAD